jgi:hypothetical protein
MISSEPIFFSQLPDQNENISADPVFPRKIAKSLPAVTQKMGTGFTILSQ